MAMQIEGDLQNLYSSPLTSIPPGYDILHVVRSCADLKEDVQSVIKIIPSSHSIVAKITRSNPYIITCLVVDEHDVPSNTQIDLIFFAGSSSWWSKTYPLQRICTVLGKPKVFRGVISLVHPKKIYGTEYFLQNRSTIIQPIYKKFSAKINDNVIQKHLLGEVEKIEIPVKMHVEFESWQEYVKFLQQFYGENSIKKIGVTGTNGKTSTVHFCAMMCSLSGHKSATIGTNGLCIYENGQIISQKNTGLTTATCTQNHTIIHSLQQQNVQYLFMEASSVGLHQGRLDGIAFDVSCFTNFTRDHLDYHHTMDEYFRQKSRLFTEFTKDDGTVVLNSEDGSSKVIADKVKVKTVLYGSGFGIIQSCSKIDDGFLLSINGEAIPFYAHGRFQVLNLACSLTALLALGFEIQDLVKQIPKLSPPLGRMQSVNINGITVIIDYAHTPDALENVLKNVEGYKIVVFGCGGDRDKAKRPIMGEIAVKNADYVIVTSDNPRSEEPSDIVKDIISGMGGKNFEVILDRKGAIYKAIEIAKKGQYVIIAGKGSENYQEVNGTRIPFSDFDVVTGFQS